ncbi:MAG: ribosome maturation factor RimM [Actinomycetota bacterium]|nr:ribosome maturation factor RimM [Actinomycetota bacterium]
MSAEAASDERVLLGRVVGAHALRGEVRVRFFGDGPGQLLNAERVFLGADDTRADRARPCDVERTGTGRAGEVRLKLEGVDDRSAAEALKGQAVFGLRAELPVLGDDEFYWHELVGFDVVSEEGEAIGRVRELWETGAHDVLVVDDADGRQILLPTAREIMTRIDRDTRRIEIKLLPGLLDQEA